MHTYFTSAFKMHLFEHPDNGCPSCHYCVAYAKQIDPVVGFAPVGRGERRRVQLADRKAKTGSRGHGVQNFVK